MNDEKQTTHGAPDTDILMKERDEYLAGWRRAKADYENLKKETEKARGEFADFATEQCLIRLLPAIDQYEIALRYAPPLDAIPETERRAFETWITGLMAVKQLWEDAAEELGLERVPRNGPMNPSLHEAVGTEPSREIPSGHIVRLIENGYVLNGKLIRPAKVVIATEPSGTKPGDNHATM